MNESIFAEIEIDEETLQDCWNFAVQQSNNYKLRGQKDSFAIREQTAGGKVGEWVAYNALKDKHEEMIDLEKRNSVIIIKVNINKNTIAKLEFSNNEKFLQMSKLISSKEYKGDVTAIAIPYGADIPKWVVEFIDYTTIIHDNLSSFPIESIGISTLNSRSVPYSNILQL